MAKMVEVLILTKDKKKSATLGRNKAVADDLDELDVDQDDDGDETEEDEEQFAEHRSKSNFLST